jgi:hypothetical protein
MRNRFDSPSRGGIASITTTAPVDDSKRVSRISDSPR